MVVKIREVDGVEVARLADIEEAYGTKRFERFKEWFAWKTGAIHDGEMYVYEWDVRKFEEESVKNSPALDKGSVALIDWMGDDDAVVRAARVSYGKGTKTKREDAKLIEYLMLHDHMSPFEMVQFTFRVHAPLFVVIQWLRHRTGSFNQVSSRYSEMPDEFYVPELKRVKGQDSKNRQSSGEPLDQALSIDAVAEIVRSYSAAYAAYEKLLAIGVARELARIVLPQGLYTTFYWSVNLRNALHFVELRTDPHAQEEIREYAELVKDALEFVAPVSVAAFEKKGSGSGV